MDEKVIPAGFAHCSEDFLESYILNRVSDEERDQADDHLMLCEPCRVRFEEVERFVIAMRRAARAVQLEDAEAAEKKRLRPSWFKAPLFAGMSMAAVAAVVVMVVVRDAPRPKAVPVPVELQAYKGGAMVVPAGRSLELKLDARGLPPGSFEVKIVDSSGDAVTEGAVVSSNEAIRFNTGKALNAGTYFVRIFPAGKDKLLREYGVVVR